MADPEQLPELAIALVIVGVVLYAGIAIFGGVEQRADTGANITVQNQSANLDGTEWVQLRDGTGTDETVRNSLGYAMRFSGASDSYLTSDSGFEVSATNNWTVSQPVWINSTATSRNMTVTAVGDPDLVIQYIGNTTDNEWRAVYYETAGVDTHVVSVNATNVTNVNFVRVSRQNDTLAIWANETRGETAAVSSDGAAFGGNLTQSEMLDGKLDETRTFARNISETTWDDLRANPVLPQKDTDRTARIMYDSVGSTSVPIYWASTSATASNISYVDGFDGAVMEEKTGMLDVTGENDYRWSSNGPAVQPVEGSRLDGAPVLWASYEYNEQTAQEDLLDDIANAYEFAALLPIIIVLVGVVGLLITLRGRR